MRSYLPTIFGGPDASTGPWQNPLLHPSICAAAQNMEKQKALAESLPSAPLLSMARV